jgi:hypothetical protein
LNKLIEDIKKKTSMPGYEGKVPEAVRAENAKKQATYETEMVESVKSQNILTQFL